MRNLWGLTRNRASSCYHDISTIWCCPPLPLSQFVRQVRCFVTRLTNIIVEEGCVCIVLLFPKLGAGGNPTPHLLLARGLLLIILAQRNKKERIWWWLSDKKWSWRDIWTAKSCDRNGSWEQSFPSFQDHHTQSSLQVGTTDFRETLVILKAIFWWQNLKLGQCIVSRGILHHNSWSWSATCKRSLLQRASTCWCVTEGREAYCVNDSNLTARKKMHARPVVSRHLIDGAATFFTVPIIFCVLIQKDFLRFQRQTWTLLAHFVATLQREGGSVAVFRVVVVLLH